MSFIRSISLAESVSASLFQPVLIAVRDSQAEDSKSVPDYISQAALHEAAPRNALLVLGKPSASTRAARLSALWFRIQEFGRLNEGWAGRGSVPPSKQTVHLSRNVLECLPSDLRLPHVSASGDGEVVFSWSDFGNRCEVAIDSDGYITWATVRGDDVSHGSSVSLVDLDDCGVGLESMFAEVLALDDDR